MMNSLRNSRFFARRSRNANMPARRRVSLAERSKRRRPPTNPFTLRNSRFLRLFLAEPFLARIDCLVLHCAESTLTTNSLGHRRRRHVQQFARKKSGGGKTAQPPY